MHLKGPLLSPQFNNTLLASPAYMVATPLAPDEVEIDVKLQINFYSAKNLLIHWPHSKK